MSVWAYAASATPSITALIPAAFGLALLACYKGVAAENKVIAHIAVVLTLIVLLALFMPLRSALGRGDTIALFRVGIMMVASIYAFAIFIKSFIDIRRQRENASSSNPE